MNAEKQRAADDVGTIQDYLVRTATKLETKLLEACRRIDEPTALGALTELLDVRHVKHVAEKMLATTPTTPEVPTYMLSSLFIQDAVHSLTQDAEEDLRYATGFAVERNAYAITRLLEFELSRKTVVAAEGAQESVNRLMIFLHNHDHKLYMTWHSHPGSGPSSTAPSSTDLDFHRRLELGNYPVIGAIVSRQGYVRFFSYQRTFKVSIYGKGMEAVNEQQHLYKLH